jgi:glucose/arabinose dehydrogenase
VPSVYVAATRLVRGVLKLQIIRITVDGQGAGIAQRPIFTMRGAPTRIGGHLAFGPDGRMYLGVGDTGQAGLAQRSSDPHGKILRMNANASVPADNPIAGSRVFARGVRNPLGSDFDPATGALWTTDSGVTCNDEVERVAADLNLGWGAASTCATPPPAPVNTNQSGIAPTLPAIWWANQLGVRGLTFCDGCGLGSQREGSILVGTSGANEVRALTLSAERDAIVADAAIYSHGADVLALGSAPDGDVYLSDATGIWRLHTT